MIDAQTAQTLVDKIDYEAANPEQSIAQIEEGLGLKKETLKEKGIFSTIWSFLKSYICKDPNLKDEEWLEAEFSKPEYAGSFDGTDDAEKQKKRSETAKGIVGSIEDYEQARADLAKHIKNGGSRESWLARKINAGAEANGMDPAEYANEIIRGLDGANEELLNLRSPEMNAVEKGAEKNV
ncbi:hypothetical protein FACS1894142_8920 [Spirochaetia bacterium]|nr:hypothetical protein FACS1894142_8920 [Spirochaetia bacterium]